MLSRREAIAVGLGTMTSLAASKNTLPEICIFSKHLQWLNIADAAAVAAEAGFDGVDITVRDGGHVPPERAAANLPAAVESVRKAGLRVPMITAGIVNAGSPHAEDILRTAAALGIHHYRWGGFSLDPLRPIPRQLADLEPQVRDLAALNRQYGSTAMYHTHSGAHVVGASIWDLYLLLRNFDPDSVSVNFDVAHATVEGGLGGWMNSAGVTAPMMRGVALKDFYWQKKKSGEWEPRWCAIGQGMVRFTPFFEMLRTFRFTGPIQLHFEYPEMGGADEGKRTIALSRKAFIELARRDLEAVRGYMRAAKFGVA